MSAFKEKPREYINAMMQGKYPDADITDYENQEILSTGKERHVWARVFTDKMVIAVTDGDNIFSVEIKNGRDKLAYEISVGTAPLVIQVDGQDIYPTHSYEEYVLKNNGWKQGTTGGIPTDNDGNWLLTAEKFNEMQKAKHQAGMFNPRELPQSYLVDVPATVAVFFQQIQGWINDPESFVTGSLTPTLVQKQSGK